MYCKQTLPPCQTFLIKYQIFTGKGFGFQNNFFPEERGEEKEKTKEEKRKENDIKRIKAELDENVDFTVVRVMSSMSSNMDSTKPPPMTTEASLTEATTSITSTDGKMLEGILNLSTNCIL